MTDWTTADIPPLNGKTAVITGATGGLGYETALALAGAGASVVLTGRSDAKGRHALQTIRSQFPNARIIVLSTYAGDVQVLRALKAGARAYIRKGHVHRELLDTIRAVHAGQKRIPPEVATELAEHAGEDDLTPREIDVLRLIAYGNANKEIAGRLSIGEETVKSHITNILEKLGANDRTHAVTLAVKRGIIEL